MNETEHNQSENTIHKTCRRLVELLVHHGAEYAVCCPGSRNAPLLMALARCKQLRKVVITDERSAGFAAIGLAQQTQRLVAVVCTSGSALLNLAPAAAEAYYAHLPLMIVSADRPKEWIDQNDSQTMRQPEALASVTKWRRSLPSLPASDAESWWVNRMLNEAFAHALQKPFAPIHINIHIGEPICDTDNEPSGLHVIEHTTAMPRLGDGERAVLAKQIACERKVMIVAGFMPENDTLAQSLIALAKRSNVVVLSEQLANVKGLGIITQTDVVLSEMLESERDDYAPDLLIYAGGAIVSKNLKMFLRKHAQCQQWRVGVDRCIIDTMQHCTRTIGVDAADFFKDILSQPVDNAIESEYSHMWHSLAQRAAQSHHRYVADAPWCNLSAMHTICQNIPPETILHLSNGLSVRLAQLFALPQVKQWWCNRGISGIDGCTSTALGASIAAKDKDVLLITGDMSFGYDVNGLSSQYNTSRFKVIVLCNSGGGIFRFIGGTSSLPELEEYFEVRRDMPVDKYAAAFGFNFYSAASASDLLTELTKFFADNHPAILAVDTDSAVDAEVLRGYYRRNKKNNK